MSSKHYLWKAFTFHLKFLEILDKELRLIAINFYAVELLTHCIHTGGNSLTGAMYWNYWRSSDDRSWRRNSQPFSTKGIVLTISQPSTTHLGMMRNMTVCILTLLLQGCGTDAVGCIPALPHHETDIYHAFLSIPKYTTDNSRKKFDHHVHTVLSCYTIASVCF